MERWQDYCKDECDNNHVILILNKEKQCWKECPRGFYTKDHHCHQIIYKCEEG